MKIFDFIFFIIYCSLIITNCMTQWVQQNSGTTNPLYDCDFINQNTGWVSGDGGVILKTTDGGINWVQQNSGVIKPLYGIEAVDANIIYCVGWWQTILKSTNGGTNWIIVRNGPSGVGSSFYKTFFLNANTGWLLRGGGGYVLRTTDGSSSFDSTWTNNSFMWDIFFKDAQTGVLCGNVALIMKSIDGGITWTQIFLPVSTGSPNLYRISFVGDFGWVIGEGGPFNGGRFVWRTTNFGSSWDSIARVPYPTNNLNYSVFFSSLNIGYCGGTSGYIFKSTNGGFNWLQQNSPSNGFRNDFWFANDSLGWCIGGGGQIYKTTNGGTYVAIEPISNKVPDEFNLFQNYPNPFNVETIIEFNLNESDIYNFKIFDVLGRETEILFNEYKVKGNYRIKYNAWGLSSGTYFYKLSSGKYNQTKKLTLIK